METTQTIRGILREDDDDLRFRRLSRVVLSDPEGGYCLGSMMLSRRRSALRALGADLVSQAANVDGSLADRAANRMVAALQEEEDPTVLQSLITGLGHRGRSGDLDVIMPFALSTDPEVREAVAFAIASLPLDERSVEVAIRLSSDEHPAVRDWAAFTLAESDADSTEIRGVLYRLTSDPDADTKAEAVYGLARRRDPRAKALVEQASVDPNSGALFERARQELSQPPEK